MKKFFLALLFLSSTAKADNLQLAVGSMLGWMTPQIFDMNISPKTDSPHLRHFEIAALSIGTSLLYEAARKQIAGEEFNVNNVYAGSLGTLARISVSW